jgi:UDP-N-acetyl-D-mannosaminuronic acid dehydrogenase
MGWKKINYKKSEDILVIGLGQIGYHNADYITSKGFHVDGYDIDKRAVDRSKKANVIYKETLNFEDYDYYLICISTHDPKHIDKPFLEGLFEISEKLSSEAKTDALVSIESTVPKGTCKKVIDILNHRLHVSHLPHRFYEHEKSEHGVRQTRVMGGCDNCCLDEAVHFYGDLLDIPLHLTPAIEYAELSKLVENTYRYLEIAFAEELSIVLDDLNLDFDTLRMAVNSKWNVDLLEAREGIDGHCLPKDSQMYLDIAKRTLQTSIIDAAKNVDENYRTLIEDTRQLKESVLLDILVAFEKSSIIH